MTLTRWRSHINTKITANQARYIREGWQRAKAEGWQQRDWAGDCAAMLGISLGYAESICVWGGCGAGNFLKEGNHVRCNR